MMEIPVRGGYATMNLVGLILIAALSGGIVAVSLRLRASASSDRLRFEGDRLPDEDRRKPSPEVGSGWFRDPFGLEGRSGTYRAVENQPGS